ncbi:MAG TPA: IS5 family transposase [Gemmatimonadaceae bacterium]|nr:IS5 family transposase [Gemmatimonadaceae bacterium]
MRGDDQQPDSMFSYVSPEQRVPRDHPLRAIRQLVDEILRDMSREFDKLYAAVGRPSIPPERLLRAQLLQVFYSIRSERLLLEQLDYNILFRWFVGLTMDEPIWDPTVFTKNRDRLLNQELARGFLRRVVERAADYMSDEHFTVDGTLIEAWASQKSFQRKDGPPGGDARNFHGESRTNDTHASTTDPDAKLYRRSHSAEARLAYLGHLVIDNRHGLIVEAMATTADGYAERDAAVVMLRRGVKRRRQRRCTIGADKGYDTFGFVAATRALGVTPHVTQNVGRRGGSAIDGRTTRHDRYAKSQHARPRIEPAFGWLKTVGWLRKVKLRGLPNVDWLVVFASAAFNLRRLTTLMAAPA